MEETGLQVFSRLTPRPDLRLDPDLFDDPPVRGKVYEFYGETGKTELMLQSVIQCILPESWNGLPLGGAGASVLYFDLDCHLSLLRIAAILESRFHQTLSTSGHQGVSQADRFIRDCLQRLHVVHCCTITQLLVTLHGLDSFMARELNTCLLVVDSIAAFYWTDRQEGHNEGVAKVTMTHRVIECLQKILTDYNLIGFVAKPVLFQRKKTGETDVNRSVGAENSNSGLEHYEYLPKVWQALVYRRFIIDRCGAQYRVSWTGKGMACMEKSFDICNAGVTLMS